MHLNRTLNTNWLSALILVALSLGAQAQTLRLGNPAGGPRSGLSAAPGALTPPERSVDFIVALVDNEPITNQDVKSAAQRLRTQAAQSGLPELTPAQFNQEALEMLIFERSQLQWAKTIGLRVSDAELQERAQAIASRNQLGLEDFYRELERQGVSKTRFLQTLREQQILQRLRDREVPSRIVVTDAEIDLFLRQEKAERKNKGRIELAQILIPVPEGAADEQWAQAERTARQWLQDIRQGADFFALAQARSAAADRANSGRMGLRPLDRYPELFLQAVQDTPVGGVVGPIRSGAGLHLLKVVEQPPTAITMPQTRSRHILLRPSAELSQTAARARLFQYKKDLESGRADFAQLAREHSQDASASQGGDLGWVTPGQFVPEFEQVMDTLAPGQISDPLISRFGLHLIQVLERRDVPLSATQEREYARNALREQKFPEALQTWSREIRGKAFIEYREPPQ